jgi:cytochrome c oxidase cbb3-type subunit 4
MDIGTLRGLGTALVLFAFVGLLIWVFGGKQKNRFDEAANLPFADEPEQSKRDNASGETKE